MDISVICNNINRYWYVIGFILLFFSEFVYSEPVVSNASGIFSNSNSVTITGTGFGTKSTATPLVWDTFENGTVGNQVLTSSAIIGQWDVGTGYDVPEYSSTMVHSGSKSAMLSTSGTTVYNMSLSKNASSFPVIYLDWWVYVHYNSIPTRNWKPFRIYGYNDLLQSTISIMCPNAGGVSSVIREDGSNDVDWNSPHYTNNNWYHWQVLLRESSSAGTADGVARIYVDGSLYNNLTGVVTRITNNHWNQIRIGHYWTSDAVPECPASTGATLYLDNVYVDTSWARVELGNNPVYTNSTYKEIQIPVSWSDGSITITVNQSSFRAGDTAYLFVSDSNGDVNQLGYQVTIGSGSSDGSNLLAPTNLKIL